uniref:Uncharacterized protein n=1 Tax=Phytophthora ramorum TaxID=164328 RepID=H3H602_PHYRM
MATKRAAPSASPTVKTPVKKARVLSKDQAQLLTRFSGVNQELADAHPRVLAQLKDESAKGYEPFEPWLFQKLAETPALANWKALCRCPDAFELLLNHVDRVSWDQVVLCAGLETQFVTHLKFHHQTRRQVCRYKAALPFLLRHPQVDWCVLSGRKWALELVQQHLDRADWSKLSSHDWAMDVLKQHPDKVWWEVVSEQAWAVPLLEMYPDRVHWPQTSWYKFSYPLVDKFPDRADWHRLSTLEWAIPLIEKFPTHAKWNVIVSQPWARKLAERSPDIVDWRAFSSCSWALQYLKERPDQVNWDTLSCKRWAISMLREHPGRVVWSQLIHQGHWILPLIKKYPEHVDWSRMPRKDWALHLVLEHLEPAKVDTFVANLNWNQLSSNKLALPLLRQLPERANWGILSAQKWALPLLRQHPDRVNWNVVVRYGPWALPLLKKFPERVNWKEASKFGWALPLVLEHIDRLGTTSDAFLDGLNWSALSHMQDAFQILRQYPDRADWGTISEQHWAISLLELYPRRIVWKRTLRMHWSKDFVLQHFDEVDWYDIATTTNFLNDHHRSYWVLNYVRQNVDRQLHHQFMFYLAPSRQRYSYARFKELRGDWLRKELSEFIYHPARVQRWIERNPDRGIEEM